MKVKTDSEILRDRLLAALRDIIVCKCFFDHRVMGASRTRKAYRISGQIIINQLIDGYMYPKELWKHIEDWQTNWETIWNENNPKHVKG